MPYIYDEFYQVGAASNTSREGYGLGLSIVHRLVSLLGLKLDVHPEVGHGSTFALEMPAGATEAKSVTAAPADVAGHVGPHAPARILLVDDDAGVRNATAMLLRVEGYTVACAASLAEVKQALRAPQDLPPAL